MLARERVRRGVADTALLGRGLRHEPLAHARPPRELAPAHPRECERDVGARERRHVLGQTELEQTFLVLDPSGAADAFDRRADRVLALVQALARMELRARAHAQLRIERHRRLVERHREAERGQRLALRRGVLAVHRLVERRERLGAADPAERAQRESARVRVLAGHQLGELGDPPAALGLGIRDAHAERVLLGRARRANDLGRAWTTDEQDGCNEHARAQHARILHG